MRKSLLLSCPALAMCSHAIAVPPSNQLPPIATSTTFGIMKPDNSSITINNGIITAIGGGSVPIATTSVPGKVQPDGTTVDVNGSGVISVPTATTSLLGLVKPDGTTVTISNGIISSTNSVPLATVSVPGKVQPDGATVDVNGSGVISVPAATTSLLGLVRPDGNTCIINTGLLVCAGTASNVGTTTSATSPHVPGDPTTGFYSAGFGLMDVAANGAQVVEFGAAGVSVKNQNGGGAHLNFRQTTAPSLSCSGTGTPTLDAAASDAAMLLTEGTNSSGCTVTFAGTFSASPHCVVYSPNGAANFNSSNSSSAVTITNSSATGNMFEILCL